MNYEPSALWRKVPEDVERRLEECFSHAPAGTRVFFRADDVGAPGARFRELMEIFRARRAPLSLAVVPVWLTATRCPVITKGATDTGLFCWHQHGYRHKNHEPAGKKMEFGESRSRAEVVADLARGMERLHGLMGPLAVPVFTAPWNRLGETALEVLGELGFCAVSRSKGAKPPAPRKLPDFPVHVDLHTRKEPTPGAGWDALFSELSQALAGGLCGVMIHHQRANPAAWEFLDLLAAKAQATPGIETVHLGHLAGAAPSA